MATENTLFFGKWSPDGIKVTDLGLVRYINLEPKLVPHTFGKNTQKRFEKVNMSIVERLVNKLMRSGQGKRKLSGKYIRTRQGCGKKFQTMEMVEEAFEKIEKETKQNPVQILVSAIENASPNEDITRVQKGGVAYTEAVDISPMKRMDESLKNIALAVFSGSYKNKTDAASALAKELILAANNDNQSFAIKRKFEVERIAAGSR